MGVNLMNHRVQSAIEDISLLLPKIFADCGDIENITNNQLYVNLGSYSESICNVLRRHFCFISDMETLYLWFNLSVDWMKLKPYDTIREFSDFFTIWEKKDGGWEIVDKLTCDLDVVKENSEEENLFGVS